MEVEEAASAERHDPVASTQVRESPAVWLGNWLADHNKVFIWCCSMNFPLGNVFPRISEDKWPANDFSRG